jgi:hypothetical protein
MGQTEGHWWNLGSNLNFTHLYSPNLNQEISPLVNPRTENASGVDLRGPQIRDSLERTAEALEPLENLC